MDNVSEIKTNLTEYIDENFGANASYVQGLLARYQKDRKSVDESWQAYFDELLGSNGQPQAAARATAPSKAETRAAAPDEKAKPKAAEVASDDVNAKPITGP